MASLAYFIICTWISPITSALVDEAVYPAKAGEIVSPDGSVYVEKDGVVTKAAEV